MPRPADRLRRFVASALVLVPSISLVTERVAHAYCQTTLCEGGASGVRCVPATSEDCGVALTFRQGCLGYSLHNQASARVSYAEIEAAMRDAFDAWISADCGGGAAPGVRADDLGAVSCGAREYNLDAGNANIVLFHEDAWPYEGAGNTLALTTVTYGLDDGAIYDADLEINATVDLTVGSDPVAFDLASIVTHEAGHMLGLAHTPEVDATMTVQYFPGDTKLRTLHPDDEAALCASYPPRDVSTCDPTPRRGLATVCDPPPIVDDSGCGCRTALGTTSGPSAPLSLLAVGLAVASRRWARARQARP
ncbi:MAG: matrixin family metalloprotease [Deltaproteobacteria bacterium]|nr:matrixin family metalloprotease [Deltaproteobacteria bacterium]